MKKKHKAAVNVNFIPQEIEEYIMSWAPVKTILRFISVCKLWYSLFLSHSFISMHKKNNPSNNNLHLVMRVHKRKDIVVSDGSSVVHSHIVGHPQSGCAHDHNYDQRVIVGSCNGIVCVLGLRHRCTYLEGNYSDYICLWNPALRIKKYIRVHDDVEISDRAFIGFGFHAEFNDYKVIRFQQSSLTVDKQVEIYSLSSDSWRSVKVASTHNMHIGLLRGFPHCHERGELGVYVKNAYYWAVVQLKKQEQKWGYSTVIFSFDLGEEVFKETIVPLECTDRHTNMILFNYNESLAMLTFCRSVNHSPYIWVTKDYGLPQSWTKLCTIDIDRSFMIRGFIQEKNEVIFSRDASSQEQERRLIVFDIDKSRLNHQSSTANIEVLKDAIEVLTFTESLLLLGSNNLVYY